MKRLLILVSLMVGQQALAKMTYNWSGGGKDTTKIGFSLHNKSGKAIYVTIENDSLIKEKGVGGFLQKTFGGPDLRRVLKDAFLDLPLNTAKETTVTIYDCSSLDSCETTAQNILYKAKFPKNKTIYINWAQNKLYKQQGPLKGFTGATDQGYDLKNNVTDGDIKKLK